MKGLGIIPKIVAVIVTGVYIVPSDAWAPASVVEGSVDEYGHPWIKAKTPWLTKANIDDPGVWANLVDMLESWGW